MSELMTSVRPLEVIEAELDLLEKDTRQKETALIENYIEVGRRLEEVKAQLDHGQWGPWLEKRGYPQPKAIKLMKVFRAYGTEQQSLFGGEAKSKAFSNLGFHKLVQLLAIGDEGEREDFVAEHDVENMSTRELEKALKERAEAIKRAEDSDAKAKAAEEARAKMEMDMKMANASAENQKENAKKYKTEADRLLTELKELKARPVDVAVEVKEPSRDCAMTASSGHAQLNSAQALDAPVALSPEELEKLTADAVEKARAEDAERIATMEKQLASADGDVASFRVHYNAWQENFNKMAGYLAKIADRDAERAGKLRMDVKAVVERMVVG